MSESCVTRARAFLTARRTRRWLGLTLLASTAQVLVHFAGFVWVLNRYQDLGLQVPLGRSLFFVVGIPLGIYAIAWSISILVAALWTGSDRYWRLREQGEAE